MSFDDLVAKFQEVWPSIQSAIQGAGAALSQEMCAWFMRDDAEYDIGKGVGTLGNGASATLTLNATVDTGTGGSVIVNTASVSASDIADNFPFNDSDSASIQVAGADLAVVKTVDDLSGLFYECLG